jgi:regulator of protease activity HflC (stomatin/prohibitin superfamily)
MRLRLKWWEVVIWVAMLLAACGLCYWGVTVDARFTRYAWLLLGILAVILLIRVFTLAFLRVLKEFERLVVFRKGKYLGEKKPPVVFVIPWVDTAVPLDSRQHSAKVSGAHCLTTDGVTIDVDLSFFWKICNAETAAKAVDNLEEAVKQLATGALQAKLAESSVADVLRDRPAINKAATEQINGTAKDWGVEVTGFTSRMRLPPELEDAFTKQVEAYRAQSLQTRARVDALQSLNEAAAGIDHDRFVMKLVALETLSKMGEARSTKYILPMELAGLVGPLAQSLGVVLGEPEAAGSGGAGARVGPQKVEASTQTRNGVNGGPPVTGETGAAAEEVAVQEPAPAGGQERGGQDEQQAATSVAENAGGTGEGSPTAGENVATAGADAPVGPEPTGPGEGRAE